MVNYQTLFEQFNRLIDKPLEFNSLLTEALQIQYQALLAQYVDGVPMLPDAQRGKTLSMSRPVFQASLFGQNLSDRYLKMGEVPTQSLQGMFLPRPATITGLWAKSRSTGNWTIEVRRNGVPISLVGITVSGGSGFDANVDMDLDAGDTLQVFANGSNISHIIAGVELAWRAL